MASYYYYSIKVYSYKYLLRQNYTYHLDVIFTIVYFPKQKSSKNKGKCEKEGPMIDVFMTHFILNIYF